MKFSLIIPTFNRWQQLAQTLTKLETLKYPRRDFEVIVVDNNSTDQTKTVINRFQKKRTLTVYYAFESRQGRTFASMRGLQRAQYDRIVFIDDDIEVNPLLLQQYRHYYQKNPRAAVIGGRIIAQLPDTASANSLLVQYVQHQCPWVLGAVDFGPRPKKLKYPQALFIGNLSLRLSAFSSPQEVLNPFLGRAWDGQYLYGEDVELCLRLHLQHQEILYVPELVVENQVEQHRLSWQYIYQRHLVAGIERYIIEQELRDFLITPQRFSVGNLFKGVLGRRYLENRIQGIFNCAEWWGYTRHGANVYQRMKVSREGFEPSTNKV